MQMDLDFDSLLPENSGDPFISRHPPTEHSPPPPPVVQEEAFNFVPIRDSANNKIEDYSSFPANHIYLVRENGILLKNRPSYIPPFDISYLKKNKYLPPVIKINDYYLVLSGKEDPLLYKLSLDGLAASLDYYMKTVKAANKIAAQEAALKMIEKAKKYLDDKYHPLSRDSIMREKCLNIISGKIKPKPLVVKIIPSNIMSFEQSHFFNDSGYKKSQKWQIYREIRDDLKNKWNDMACQIDELESSYSKGAETSYGSNNTTGALFNDLGILAKRQNGDTINSKEIAEIKSAFDKIFVLYGNLKKISAGYGLTVSHSGTKNMHASRYFVGVFSCYFKTIGVRFSDTQNAHLTLAHELAHFLDCQTGAAHQRFFSSDKPGSMENIIAVSFRGQMNKKNQTTILSAYLNRTCECFARAMEQYCAFLVSPSRYFEFNHSEAYMNNTSFEKNIIPLINSLLIQRDSLWHDKDYFLENTKNTILDLDEKAKETIKNEKIDFEIKKLSDAALNFFANNCPARISALRENIDRVKNEKFIPGNTFNLFVQLHRTIKFKSLISTEYRHRLAIPGTKLLSVSRGDNPIEISKENIVPSFVHNDTNNKPVKKISPPENSR